MSLYDQFSPKEIEVLLRRAERAAHASQDTQAGGVLINALVVSLGREQYALPLEALSAAYEVNVNLTTPIVPVPCAPAFVAGVANVRGRVIPVIDLAALLGVPGDETAESASLIIVSSDQMSLALRVGIIGDAIVIRQRELVPVPETLDLAKPGYLQGTLPDGTGLLDLDAILNDPALIVDDAGA
jgi:purine-binding chemotaxis protein CheW